MRILVKPPDPAGKLMAGSCLPVLGAVLIAPVLPKMQDHFASTPGATALVPLAHHARCPVITVPA
nr:hypothetical protein [Streptomyces djakartensis]